MNEAWIIAAALVAYRATRRNPARETFPIQVRWGGVVLGGAVIYLLGEGILW